MEKLEKYIIENREEFDCAVPSLKVWAEIDKKLEKRHGRRVQMWRGLRIAASVAILVASGFWGGAYLSGNFNQTEGALAQFAPEHAELEQYYTQQVAQKTRQLVSLNQDGLGTVQEDLRRLDESFLELMQEYQKLPPGSGEAVIQAMLENYQTKLDILERVLEKIDHNNPKVDIENEAPKQKLQNENEGVSI